MRTFVAILAVLGAVCVCQGRIITVDDDGPADFSTIQAAIDDANDGDTIIVADGTYTGVGNRGIDFWGKAITVQSESGADNCIIDCQMADRGFSFRSGEDANSVLAGLTITNGRGPWDLIRGSYLEEIGGGVYVWSSSPTIRDCVIKGNSADNGGGIICCEGSAPTIRNCLIEDNSGQGGGIHLTYSDPTIVDCVISNNIAPLMPGMDGGWATTGGGMYSALSSPLILNCVISDNAATAGGGGLFCSKGSPIIKNCTIRANTADSRGGAIKCYADVMLTISNSIVWGNSAHYGRQISLERIDLLGGCPTVGISYTDLEGGLAEIDRYGCGSSSYVIWGAGNIDADPCFADPSTGDYHLKSQGGRWEPATQDWIMDDVTSPCIDAGDPMSPIGLEPFPNGGIVNMGVYGGTSEASKSYFGGPPCETIVAGDINGDCKVNYLDFRLMTLHWLEDRN